MSGIVVPLSLGAKIKVLGALVVDKHLNDGQQLLLFEDPLITEYPERDMSLYIRIKADRVVRGENNIYLALAEDILEDSERWRGIRKCCVDCKKACPDKSQKSHTKRSVAAKTRLRNFVLTKDPKFGNFKHVETEVSNHMAEIGAKGGRCSTPERRASAHRASIIRWAKYKRRNANELETSSDSEAITDVAQ
jgi:hypothetical protein